MPNSGMRSRNNNNVNNNSGCNFSIPIYPSDGELAVLDFFTNQVKEVCYINNHENNQAIAFFSSCHKVSNDTKFKFLTFF